MTSIDPSPTQVTVADVFVQLLAAGDFDRFAMVLEPDVSLTALLPAGLHEWHGADRVADAFVKWFGGVDEFELLEAAVGQIGRRLQMQWLARVRGGGFGDVSHVVEQHVYVDSAPSGRIQSMAMLCSGFSRERPDA